MGFHDGPTLQYVHLPKTGGTSVQLAMVRWTYYSSRNTLLFKSDEASIKGSSTICPPGAEAASILIGHRGFGFCGEVERSPRGLVTFATFRRSASRIVSLVDYNVNRMNPRAMRLFGREPLATLIKRYNSTRDVVEEGEALLRFAGSQQVRFMCGYECLGPNAAHNQTITLGFMMQRAMENVDKLDMIGLTEELNECIRQVRFHLALQRPSFSEWPEANGAPGNKRRKSSVVLLMDDEAKAILDEWARPDQELYEHAKARYLKKQAIARHCLKHKLVPPTPHP